ncbi:IS66 family insertion sequence element accessory protein TnpB, partial [Porphyromonas levii]|uniref:IS66 family insertion sequence element accessory protein TnpB n=1 Tax=Porphyromonas levii TaxID=28114 RepID=UPI0011000530
MFNLNESNCFFLFISGVDLRKEFGGLEGIILRDGRNPLEGDVFVFINRSRTTMKLLHWERGGYV